MKFSNILNCKSNDEFRKWLEINHLSQKECWIQCKRGKMTEDNVFYYIDAVYTALCFGWIDSTQRKIDGVMMQRFSPRAKNSSWSELNKARCKFLIERDLMTPEGYRVLPDLDNKPEIGEDILKLLKEDCETWKNFNSFPELYQRIKIGNIQRERKKPDVFEKMLNNFIKKTKENKMYGNWNDYGRLL